jgi:hypothetical protein
MNGIKMRTSDFCDFPVGRRVKMAYLETRFAMIQLIHQKETFISVHLRLKPFSHDELNGIHSQHRRAGELPIAELLQGFTSLFKRKNGHIGFYRYLRSKNQEFLGIPAG